jgi:hypothetical protein
MLVLRREAAELMTYLGKPGEPAKRPRERIARTDTRMDTRADTWSGGACVERGLQDAHRARGGRRAPGFRRRVMPEPAHQHVCLGCGRARGCTSTWCQALTFLACWDCRTWQ